MKKNVLLILFAFIVYTGFSQLNSKNFIDENYIEVIGQAEMEITPDEIYMQIIQGQRIFGRA